MFVDKSAQSPSEAACRRWDVFCSVIDNYGDIGIAWRLARQLAAEHGLGVRLWVDDLASFRAIWPKIDGALDVQWAEGVEVRRWQTPFPAVSNAEVVIESFGCRLPASYLEAMAASPRPPVWIHLEYLTAEDWALGCHGLPSPHPRLPLTQYFFCPGYAETSGGLLHERAFAAARAAFCANAQAVGHFRARIGLPADPHVDWRITLFAYETPAVHALLDAWARGPDRVELAVPYGRIAPAVAAWFGAHAPASGQASFERGRLRAHLLPMLPQDDYDCLLWQADCNFVRGEDSFVRAQLAGVPFVWQAYRQEEDAHLSKLAAFEALYLAGMPESSACALRALWSAWNASPEDATAPTKLAEAWQAWRAQRSALTRHAREWAARRLNERDLASRLVDFCARRLATDKSG